MDSGDLFFDLKEVKDPKEELVRARLIARAYRRMGAVAINVGDLDLSQGVDFLRQSAAQGIPLISANLLDRSTKGLLFPPYVIEQAGKVRVAFFGLANPQLPPVVQKAVEEAVSVKDPIQAAKETMERLRGKADVIVLLSDLGLANDLELLKAVPGIHLVLGGHEGQYLGTPREEGKGFVFQSYKKGMYLGRLTLTVEEPGAPFQDGGRYQRIKEQISAFELRLGTLQEQRQRQQTQGTERLIEQFLRQKAQLEAELKQAGGPVSSGNRFVWILQSVDPELPEDQEVRKWIQEAGIERD